MRSIERLAHVVNHILDIDRRYYLLERSFNCSIIEKKMNLRKKKQENEFSVTFEYKKNFVTFVMIVDFKDECLITETVKKKKKEKNMH